MPRPAWVSPRSATAIAAALPPTGRRRPPRRHRRALPGQPRQASQAARCGRPERLLHGGGDELVAIDLRQALDELGKVVGDVVTDDILDRIFRRFCIGK